MIPRGVRVLVFAAAYVLLAVAYTWPLSRRLGGVAHDLGDPLLTTWMLWWSGTQALPLTAAWWNAPIFFPAPGAFAFSEHLLGLAPIAAPLIAMSHQPLLGHNVALIATFVLSALGAHALGWTLTKRHDAAFIGALAFAFAPYRLAQIPHIQVLASFWTPICLAALHRYTESGRHRWALIAAAAWLMQALSSGYYLFFLSTLLALWALWFAAGRWTLRQFGIAAVWFGAGAVLLVPFLLGYRSILEGTYGFRRELVEIQAFSADMAGLLSASNDLLAWGWVHAVARAESQLFPGLTLIALAVFAIVRTRPFTPAPDDSRTVHVARGVLAALVLVLLAAAAVPVLHGTWRLTIAGVRVVSIARADKPLTLAFLATVALLALLPRARAAFHARSALVFYALAAFAMWVLALGPSPTFMNQPALHEAPYAWLMRLPGFDGLRVPARFWMMAVLCLATVAALAIDRLRGRTRHAVVALAAAGLLIDGWPRAFDVLPAPELRPSPAGVAARLDLPISDDIDAQAIYGQTHDRVPLLNGFSGYFPPHYYAMKRLLANRDPRILPVLAARGLIGVIVDHAADPDGALRRFVLAYPGATRERDEAGWSSYRLPRSTDPPSLPDRTGTPLAIASLSTFPSPPHAARALDGDLDTRWSGGVQQQTADATIDLAAPAFVGQVVIDLGGFFTDFPERLQIEVSRDGASWHIAWIGTTALHAYFAAVRHPREVPLVFTLNRDGVRFIRLRQTGFGTHDWSIAELHVLGK